MKNWALKGQYLLLKLISLQYNILRPVILVNNLHLWPGSITPFLDEYLFTSTKELSGEHIYHYLFYLQPRFVFFTVIKVIFKGANNKNSWSFTYCCTSIYSVGHNKFFSLFIDRAEFLISTYASIVCTYILLIWTIKLICL